MLKALENFHYKKIWEAIIRNRHPKAKSLNEALEAETMESGCLVGRITSPLSEEHKKTELAIILWDDGVDEAKNARWYCYKQSTIEPHCFTICKKDTNIFGRPITIEDVLECLNAKAYLCNYSFMKHFIYTNYLHVSPGHEPCFIVKEYCKWLSRKSLHEQTPNTWEAIAKIISE